MLKIEDGGSITRIYFQRVNNEFPCGREFNHVFVIRKQPLELSHDVFQLLNAPRERKNI